MLLEALFLLVIWYISLFKSEQVEGTPPTGYVFNLNKIIKYSNSLKLNILTVLEPLWSTSLTPSARTGHCWLKLFSEEMKFYSGYSKFLILIYSTPFR